MTCGTPGGRIPRISPATRIRATRTRSVSSGNSPTDRTARPRATLPSPARQERRNRVTQSMTGFGAAEGAVGADRLRIELRSVNHRHLQVQWKLPYELQALEQDLRDRVRKALERGHVSGSAQWVTDGVRPSSVRLDAQRARDTLAALKELKKTLKLKGDLDLAALARMPGVLTTADEGAAAAPKVDAAAVYRLADAALAALGDMRGREGAALVTDLRE